MNSVRKISKIWKSNPIIEGAGVHLKRAFGYNHVPLFDPFLMLDDFHLNYSPHYLKGFPWHPHRGIKSGEIPEVSVTDGVQVKVIVR